MGDITLSSAVRTNLLSLQSTADMMSTTQNRLSTGLKVNSALDDPTAFFTASSLNSRAGDLNRLLDSVGNAVQTVKAADDGITAITKLVESAQATARQALQKPAGSTTAQTLTGTTAIAADTAATITGSVASMAGGDTLDGLGFTDGQTITLEVDGETTTFTATTASTADVDDLVAALDANSNASVSLNGDGEIVVTANDNDTTITMGGTATIASVGFNTTEVGATNATVAAMTDTLSITDGTATAETIDMSGIDTRADLETALAALTVAASIDGNDNIEITASDYKNDVTIAAGDDFGLTNGTTEASYNSERATLETEFNNLRTQIDQLAGDASFNGVNLLDGDNLSVTFNEDGSSSLSLAGVTFDSSGLGVSAAATDGFQSDAAINSAMTELNGAISSLRSQGSTFGSNLSVIEVRQDFTKNLVNTLETGAANLTLADINEEGANMLALQTRQQLSSIAMSMASQSDQQVLRLF
jgi:flagellin-like hook-associated protein FlgL